jgi:hypothetical protein
MELKFVVLLLFTHSISQNLRIYYEIEYFTSIWIHTLVGVTKVSFIGSWCENNDSTLVLVIHIWILRVQNHMMQIDMHLPVFYNSMTNPVKCHILTPGRYNKCSKKRVKAFFKVSTILIVWSFHVTGLNIWNINVYTPWVLVINISVLSPITIIIGTVKHELFGHVVWIFVIVPLYWSYHFSMET